MNGNSAVCNKCGKSEPEVRFTMRTVNGKKYRKHVCSSCATKYRKRFGRSESSKKSIRVYNQRRRQSSKARDAIIVVDCRKSDKKRGLKCDLTRDFVRDLIKNGCSYCGETILKMGLDRIDNDLGHTQANVVAACGRCNYLRRDMPIKAWLLLVPSVRAAREAGLFGNWDGFGRYNRSQSTKL